MKTATLVGPLGLEVIEREYTVGPTKPGLDGLGVISQQNWWSTARSGGQNGLGEVPLSRIPTYLVAMGAPAAAGGAAAYMATRDARTAAYAAAGGAVGGLVTTLLFSKILVPYL